MLYYIIVILSVLAAAGAQMLLKKAAGNHYPTFWRQYVNPWVIGGYAVLGVSMLVNIFAMSHGIQLKEVGIIESLSYLFVPVLAFFIFGEKLSVRKVCAIGVIIVGVVIFFV
jgi:drug/metabolite transporter (DMT)-like permease